MSEAAPQVAVIYNPTAGRGRAKRRLQRLKELLADLDGSHQLLPTDYAGHEQELAADCVAREIPLIIAAGGDGTVSKVAHAIVNATQEACQTTLMAWPLGSGNDIVANSESARHRDELAETLREGTVRQIDVGKITIDDPQQPPRHFLNNLGLGLEAEVIQQSTAIRALRGMPLYLAAALRALLNAKLSNIELTLGDGEERSLDVAMMSIANGSRTGGGFRLLPQAEIDDGQLDLGILTAPTIPKLLWVLIKAIGQKHLDSPWVEQDKAIKIQITCEAGIPVHVDGDLLHPGVKSATIELLPKRLQIRVPQGKENFLTG